jgi:hypothetical protein
MLMILGTSKEKREIRLSLHHDVSRHGWQVELAIEWEYSSLVCIDC